MNEKYMEMIVILKFDRYGFLKHLALALQRIHKVILSR